MNVKIRLTGACEDLEMLRKEYNTLPEYSALNSLYRTMIRRLERLKERSEAMGIRGGIVSFPWEYTVEEYMLAKKFREFESGLCDQLVDVFEKAPGHEAELYRYEKEVEALSDSAS